MSRGHFTGRGGHRGSLSRDVQSGENLYGKTLDSQSQGDISCFVQEVTESCLDKDSGHRGMPVEDGSVDGTKKKGSA